MHTMEALCGLSAFTPWSKAGTAGSSIKHEGHTHDILVVCVRL